jgi:hypothetical protein
MPDGSESDAPREAPPQRGEAGVDPIRAALSFLRGDLSGDLPASRPPPLARQTEGLAQWARNLGFLLNPADLPAKALHGGQEHEIWIDEGSDRIWKMTRGSVFGMQPGIDLALVSSAEDARRFHLWEATPIEYLERLILHNLLVPGINRWEGVIVQQDDISIVTSQPRFEIVRVTTAEIDAWFATLGFEKVTDSAYYRESDNLGVFDAHDKNLVRAEDTLIPFDVIPCRPSGGFLEFIRETLAAGHQLRAVRTTRTT